MYIGFVSSLPLLVIVSRVREPIRIWWALAKTSTIKANFHTFTFFSCKNENNFFSNQKSLILIIDMKRKSDHVDHRYHLRSRGPPPEPPPSSQLKSSAETTAPPIYHSYHQYLKISHTHLKIYHIHQLKQPRHQCLKIYHSH